MEKVGIWGLLVVISRWGRQGGVVRWNLKSLSLGSKISGLSGDLLVRRKEARKRDRKEELTLKRLLDVPILVARIRRQERVLFWVLSSLTVIGEVILVEEVFPALSDVLGLF